METLSVSDSERTYLILLLEEVRESLLDNLQTSPDCQETLQELPVIRSLLAKLT